MDSYGEILKKSREAKNLDLETVERETAITRQYLEGLEAEDTGAFPGEAYMAGFMRNYAEYLGINPESVLTLYKNKKLQEAPIPEGLIVREKNIVLRIAVISAVLIAVLVSAVIAGYFIHKNRPADSREVLLDKNSVSKSYRIENSVFTGRIYKGDKLIYPTDEGEVILSVSKTLSVLGLNTPLGTIYVDLAEENELDIDGDAVSDLIVYVSDISNSDEIRGAEVRVLRRRGAYAASSSVSEDIMSASEIKSVHKHHVIFEDNRAYSFTLNGSFRGSCVFRYKVDRRDSNESYFASGEIVTMTANNAIRLWMSNANTVKFSIVADGNTYDLELGKAGQVFVEDIRWIKDSDGKFKLVVVELD